MKRTQEQVLTFTELSALGQIPSHPSLPKKNDKLLECILLMAYLGLRVSESINFTWQQVKVENKEAFVVLGKGQKQRLVFNLLNNSYIAKKSKQNFQENK
ncbi:3487_t:CDS:1 [Funneliformis geosporum]|uniref:18612_t:CDS:1 n=1 Tax=Funneliformis geosporum TaxID=1117311 RepID=A0A9W4T4F7_9GLOM|nr:18612_t:CDS:1 [Funneliformis geosporum]CAI2194976.1 3487_t:CDS:1 [Funneliformis geosporum]